MNGPKWRCDVILLRKWMVGLKAHTNQPLSSLSFRSDWKISSANTTRTHLQPLKINSFALACCCCWKLFCRVSNIYTSAVCLRLLHGAMRIVGKSECSGPWRKFKHDLSVECWLFYEDAAAARRWPHSRTPVKKPAFDAIINFALSSERIKLGRIVKSGVPCLNN